MDLPQLRDIMAGGESLTVEFKESPAPPHNLSDDQMAEAVVCLANAEGGHLIIGVANDGTVKGVGDVERPIWRDLNRLTVLLLNKTDPPLAVEAQSLDVDDHHVIVVSIPRASQPVGTTKGLYRIRTLDPQGKPRCRAYTVAEMVARHAFISQRDYAATPLPRASRADVDPQVFETLRQRCADVGDSALANLSDLDILRALSLATAPGGDSWELTVGAVLLFGTPAALERFVPTAEVAFQIVAGTSVRHNTIRRIPLIRAADFLAESVLPLNREDEVMEAMVRTGLPTLPEQAIREAIANALVHRDYSIADKVSVQALDGELVVASPGGLPIGMSLTSIVEESRARSHLLASAFQGAGLVERTGRGVERMFREQLRLGRPVPDYSRTSADRVVVSFSLGKADVPFYRFVRQWQALPREDLGTRHLHIMRTIRDLRDPTTAEVSEQTRLPVARVRTLALDLVDRGLVAMRGRGQGRHYVMGEEFWRLAEVSEVAQRTPARVTEQDRQWALTFAAHHGHITRKDLTAQRLLSASQAARLLADLKRDGLLLLRGERRGSHYVLPPRQSITASTQEDGFQGHGAGQPPMRSGRG